MTASTDASVWLGGSLGTEITLDVAGVSVTYSKNHRGIDHGSIFQEQDRKAIKSDQLDYDWYEEEGEDPTPSEMAFTRPLKHVVPRLELLGFNLERVRREYDAFSGTGNLVKFAEGLAKIDVQNLAGGIQRLLELDQPASLSNQNSPPVRALSCKSRLRHRGV